MLDNQEKIIKLINKIDELFDYFDIDDVLMSFDYDNNLKIFNDYLNDLFKDGLNNELLDMISKIDKKEIFYITKVDEYKNNNIRIQIVDYLDNLPLFIDYNLIKKYIKDNYKLANYVKDKDLLLELVDINELVILLLDSKYLTHDFIIKYMKKSNFITEIFLGMHGINNEIYRYSMYYKDNEEINGLLYNQVKDYLEKDIYQYLKASDLVKTNRKVNKLVVKIDSRFKDNIKNIEYIGCVLPVIKEDEIILDEAYIDLKDNKVKYYLTSYNSLYESLVNIANYNFYYSYDIDNKHTHSHDFESVIKDLYYYPNTFYIHEDEECYFSEQELTFLKRLKDILNIIGLEDIKSYNCNYLIKRSKNKMLKKLFEYSQIHLGIANLIKNKKINKFILKHYKNIHSSINGKYMLFDDNHNFICLLKTKREIIKFKDLKDIDYKLYGFKSFNAYKLYLKRDLEVNEEDNIVIENVIDIECL